MIYVEPLRPVNIPNRAELMTVIYLHLKNSLDESSYWTVDKNDHPSGRHYDVTSASLTLTLTSLTRGHVLDIVAVEQTRVEDQRVRTLLMQRAAIDTDVVEVAVVVVRERAALSGTHELVA